MSNANNTTVATIAAAAITTSTHAAHLLGLAEARLVKQVAAVEATKVQIAEYKVLKDTLPAGVSAPKRATVADGTTVTFEHGREASRKTLEGVIVAAKLKDGTAVQYKVRVGEGFDSKDYVVFPGSIKTVAGVAEQEAPPADGQGGDLNDDPLASIGADEVDPLA